MVLIVLMIEPITAMLEEHYQYFFNINSQGRLWPIKIQQANSEDQDQTVPTAV